MNNNSITLDQIFQRFVRFSFVQQCLCCTFLNNMSSFFVEKLKV